MPTAVGVSTWPRMFRPRTTQFYLPDTNVLVTRFAAPSGVGEVQDFMPIVDDNQDTGRQRLIRRVVCVRGSLPFRARVAPRFGYAAAPHSTRVENGQVLFVSNALSLALSASAPVEVDGPDARAAAFTVREGDCAVFALDRVGDGVPPGRARQPRRTN
jgi:Domain of unknown function (DUF5911)